MISRRNALVPGSEYELQDNKLFFQFETLSYDIKSFGS